MRLLNLAAVWFASLALLAEGLAAAETSSHEQPISGYHFLTPQTRALQDDAFANPGYLWVAAGAEAYEKKQGAGSCMSCHGESGMVGVATRYPRFDEGAQTLLNLEGRINVCRTEHQKLPALVYESQELLALSSYVAEQSRGMMTQVSISGRSAPLVPGRPRLLCPAARSAQSGLPAVSRPVLGEDAAGRPAQPRSA